MVDLGERGRTRRLRLTDMDQPLGRAVGNALEVREAVDTLRGDGPADLVELVLAAGHLLAPLGPRVDQDEGRRRAEEAIGTRRRPRCLRALDQGTGRGRAGTPFRGAAVVAPVAAPETGFVQRIATTAVGEAALRLGAGRATKDDAIDHAVGSSSSPSAATESRQATVSRRSTRKKTTMLPIAPAAEVIAAYELVRTSPSDRPVVSDVLA